MTAMMSAVWMVDSLWAMTMQVRPRLASSRAAWTVCRQRNVRNKHLKRVCQNQSLFYGLSDVVHTKN